MSKCKVCEELKKWLKKGIESDSQSEDYYLDRECYETAAFYSGCYSADGCTLDKIQELEDEN